VKLGTYKSHMSTQHNVTLSNDYVEAAKKDTTKTAKKEVETNPPATNPQYSIAMTDDVLVNAEVIDSNNVSQDYAIINTVGDHVSNSVFVNENGVSCIPLRS